MVWKINDETYRQLENISDSIIRPPTKLAKFSAAIKICARLAAILDAPVLRAASKVPREDLAHEVGLTKHAWHGVCADRTRRELVNDNAFAALVDAVYRRHIADKRKLYRKADTISEIMTNFLCSSQENSTFAHAEKAEAQVRGTPTIQGTAYVSRCDNTRLPRRRAARRRQNRLHAHDHRPNKVGVR